MSDNSLRYFAAVAEHGSIRKAAELLHVAQSAVSRQVMKLEDQFGMPLLERLPRGVRVTFAGQIVLRHARDQLGQLERVRSEIAALKGLVRGVVRIHAIEALTHEVLPSAIARFCERYPGVTFNVSIARTNEILDALREVQTDLGFAFCPQLDANLACRFRIRAPIMALVSPGHPLAAAASVTLTELTAFPIALSSGPSGSRGLIDAACRQAGVHLAPTLETNSMRLITQLVRTVGGIALLPRWAASISIRTNGLVAIRIRNRVLNSATVDAVALRSRQLSPAVNEFQNFVRAELERLGG